MPAFTSNEWFDKVDQLTNEAGDLKLSPALQGLALNLLVTGTDQGDVAANLTSGRLGKGENSDAKTTLVLDSDTLRKVFFENDVNAGMQAFMSGKIKVQGDMSQVMALQTARPSDEQKGLFQKILGITEA